MYIIILQTRFIIISPISSIISILSKELTSFALRLLIHQSGLLRLIHRVSNPLQITPIHSHCLLGRHNVFEIINKCISGHPEYSALYPAIFNRSSTEEVNDVCDFLLFGNSTVHPANRNCLFLCASSILSKPPNLLLTSLLAMSSYFTLSSAS